MAIRRAQDTLFVRVTTRPKEQNEVIAAKETLRGRAREEMSRPEERESEIRSRHPFSNEGAAEGNSLCFLLPFSPFRGQPHQWGSETWTAGVACTEETGTGIFEQRGRVELERQKLAVQIACENPAAHTDINEAFLGASR